MRYRKLFLALIVIFICKYSIGQITSNESHKLYKIEQKIKLGDFKALFELAPYFDSINELIERFAYNHISATNESQVAKRIVEVNSIFTENEIRITDSTSSQDFKSFLNRNFNKITYSKIANAFLITPLESRPIKIKFRDITENKRLALKKEYGVLLDSLKNKKLNFFIQKKDPKALFIIASEIYKGRDWLNVINPSDSKVVEYVKLLQILTNFEFAVENRYKKMTWHLDEEFISDAALNLLCYFSANYSNFHWNEKEKIFENKEIQILHIGKEDALFQLLGDKNDSIALDAFIQLTTCNPVKVIELADEFEDARIDKSWAIPTFPYRFLMQLVILTEYCKKNNIDFKGTTELQNKISRLKTMLSFTERRELEDSLIKTLTFDEITAFEYWAIIYEKSWTLTFSAGRILDVFYSQNWDNLLANKKQLDCYIKKSALFNRLGIIGVCNNYLKKFLNSSKTTLTYLNNSETLDADIKGQIPQIISGNYFKSKPQKTATYSNNGNKDFEVKDLEEQLEILTKGNNNTEKEDDAISKLLSQIKYEQIAIALNLIENYKFKTPRKKYSFMYRDWGFFLIGNFDKKEIRDDFINLYSKFTEYQLYSFYLDKAKIDYKTADNKLDYDKIYDLIKHDVVVAFVGGGGGKQDNEVYSLIKLLELTFNTTLGFPKKLCNSNNIYACSSCQRVNIWMNYLIENKLLKRQHNEPISFIYEPE